LADQFEPADPELAGDIRISIGKIYSSPRALTEKSIVTTIREHHPKNRIAQISEILKTAFLDLQNG